MFRRRSAKTAQILVIDDDTDFIDPLCRMLTRRGYDVLSAANGQEGINIFKTHPTDLVITDILLPDRDGLHVILDLQKLLPDVKIIAISGGGRCATGEEYLDDIELLCNVKYTLAKPFEGKQLFKLVHKVLA